MDLSIVPLVIDLLQRYPQYAGPLLVLAAAGVVVNVLNASLPASSRLRPYVGALVRGMDRLAVLVHRDSPGTMKMIGTASAMPPAPTPPTPAVVVVPEGESGR